MPLITDLSPIKLRSLEDSRWQQNCEDEFQFWPRTIWFDPGESTGVTIVWFDPTLLFRSDMPPIGRCVMSWWTYQLTGNRNHQIDIAAQIIRDVGGNTGLLIGVEDFILRTNNKSRNVLEPVKWIAALEFILWKGIKDFDGVKRRRCYVRQSAADAKSRFEDNRLKLDNFYTPGPDHVRDSTRHALLWLVRLRAEESKRKGFFQNTHGNETEWWENG